MLFHCLSDSDVCVAPSRFVKFFRVEKKRLLSRYASAMLAMVLPGNKGVYGGGGSMYCTSNSSKSTSDDEEKHKLFPHDGGERKLKMRQPQQATWRVGQELSGFQRYFRCAMKFNVPYSWFSLTRKSMGLRAVAFSLYRPWFERISSALDAQVDNSAREPDGNVTLQQFWSDLYKREEQLIVRPRMQYDKQKLRSPRKTSKGCSLFWTPLEGRPFACVMSCFRDCKAQNVQEAKRRFSVICWIQAVVNRMTWKESTFFVAVHIIDSYVTSLLALTGVDGGTQKESHESEASRFTCCANSHAPPVSRGLNCWILATAALCLAVATEEQHSQSVRAENILVGSVPSVVYRVNLMKINILSRLTRGILINKTPEDFLFYFLANMKNSSKFQDMYYRLLTPIEPQHYLKQYELLHSLLTFFKLKYESQYPLLTPKCDARDLPFSDVPKHSNDIRFNCLSTLPGVICFVLLSTRLAFISGFYCVLPASRITAACLFLCLASGRCPELNDDAQLRDDFCKEVFYFHNSNELLLAMLFCLPWLQHAAVNILNQKHCSVGFSPTLLIPPFQSFLTKLSPIVNNISPQISWNPTANACVDDSPPQHSVVDMVSISTPAAPYFRHSSQLSSKIQFNTNGDSYFNSSTGASTGPSTGSFPTTTVADFS